MFGNITLLEVIRDGIKNTLKLFELSSAQSLLPFNRKQQVFLFGM